MKNLYILFLVSAFPFYTHAQTIHGLWSGTLVNDSTHRIQNFELGLSEYRGKITGYTYTTFIDNDTFYYSIKRVKAERKDGKLFIVDDEMVGNNFPERAAKHVKQTTVFPLINDSTIDITRGSWSTNQTKRYYSIGGSAKLKEQEDEKQSDLLSHLQEANIKNDIAVNQNKRPENETVAKRTSFIQKNSVQKTQLDRNTDVVKNIETQPESRKIVPEKDLKKNEEVIAVNEKNDQNVAANKEEKTNENANNRQAIMPNNSNSVVQEKNKKTNEPIAQPNSSVVKQNTVSSSVQKEEVAKSSEQKISTTTMAAPVMQHNEVPPTSKELPSAVAVRKNADVQELYFKNDSLVLSLYDNGIVDGDTVSVFVNGNPVISKQMLKSVAAKKTIYISNTTDSVQLVLFAENLGTIPPNTGLLTVRDGDEIYQVHFTADLQKNASIILRRKKD
jgi:hypothetical protein